MLIIFLFKCSCFSGPRVCDIRKFYSLSPWFSYHPDLRGCDDGGKDYFLPDGYSVFAEFDYSPIIQNKNGVNCSFIDNNPNALLFDPETQDIIRLKKVPSNYMGEKA